MRWLWGMTLVLVVGGYGCSECEIDNDCGPRMECNNNSCEPFMAPPRTIGVRDGGPDAGTSSVADAGPFDSGIPDTGVRDGGRDGGHDAGPPDLGFVDAAVPNTNALVWVGEKSQGNNTTVVAEATIVDEGQATYMENITTYPDLQGTSCTLTTRELTMGAPVGFLAESIVFRFGTGNPYTLEAKGGGRFGLRTGLTIPIGAFGNVNNATFTLNAANDPASLQSTAPIVVPAPTRVQGLQPLEGNMYSLIETVRWTGVGAGTILLEVYDSGRGVVLSCEVQDNGMYNFPAQARTAYEATTRQDPQYLEVRRDTEVVVDVVAPGRGYVPVTFRTSWGPRYQLRP